MKLVKKICLFFHKQEGQTLTEYAMILLLVFLVVVAAMTILGNQVFALFNNFIGSF